MFCSKCGVQNADEAVYCSQCGNKLIPPTPSTSPLTTPPTESLPDEKLNESEKNVYLTVERFLTGVPFLVALIALSVYVLYMFSMTSYSPIDLQTFGNMAEFFGVEGASFVGTFANMFSSGSENDLILAILHPLITAAGFWTLFIMFKTVKGKPIKPTGLTIIKYAQIAGIIISIYRIICLLIDCGNALEDIEDKLFFLNSTNIEKAQELICSVMIFSELFYVVEIFFHVYAINATNSINYTLISKNVDNDFPYALGVMNYVGGVGSVIMALACDDAEKFIIYGALATAQFCFGWLVFAYISEMGKFHHLIRLNGKALISNTGVADLRATYPGYFAYYEENYLTITNCDPDDTYSVCDITEEVLVEENFSENKNVMYIIKIYDTVNSTPENEVSYYSEIDKSWHTLYETGNFFKSNEDKYKKIANLLEIASYAYSSIYQGKEMVTK